MKKILVVKANGKRRCNISPNDLERAMKDGWREPKVGDIIQGLKVVELEKNQEDKKPKKVKEEKKEVSETGSNDILT